VRASAIVRHLCHAVVERVDLRRLAVVLALVDALLAGGRLSLTALGRALASDAAPKHRIKRVDRFLGNRHGRRERVLFYSALARRLLGQSRRPVVLLDWTQMTATHYALVAAIASQGRAVPIYSEVHPKKWFANRAVQQRFLLILAEILPPKTRPVIVADAGFKTPFFQFVDAIGWDFVIRLRGNCRLKRFWPVRHLRFKRAFAMAIEEPRSLGEWVPYAQGNWHTYRIILGARPIKARRRRNEPPYARRALEPWLLATNIRSELPKCIVALYATRMQIEETFRDAKNPRLGWALEHANSRTAERLEALLLIAALAFVATVLAGAALEERGLARQHQANSVRSRRVLSLVRLGTYALQSDSTDLELRHVITKRFVLQVYVQRPFQKSLPFTRLRRGRWL